MCVRMVYMSKGFLGHGRRRGGGGGGGGYVNGYYLVVSKEGELISARKMPHIHD